MRFYCSPHLRRAVKKNRHRVGDQCGAVLTVLSTGPQYGLVVPRYAPLRKMRVQVPKARLGKSGGYRLIYREALADEETHVMLMRLYFKGDRTDLDEDEYAAARAETEAILADVLAFDFEAFPRFD